MIHNDVQTGIREQPDEIKEENSCPCLQKTVWQSLKSSLDTAMLPTAAMAKVSQSSSRRMAFWRLRAPGRPVATSRSFRSAISPTNRSTGSNSIVMDGNGSSASSTVYYAAIRGGGPLLATGRYDSQFTKQLDGQWKFVHHCYTGDPVADTAGAESERRTDGDALSAEDRLAIIELIARFNSAMQERDGQALVDTFTPDGVLQNGDEAEVSGAQALSQMVDDLPAAQGRCWNTNFIIEGTTESATARAYFARIDGDAVSETGLYHDTVRKGEGEWRIVRHHYLPDQAPD